MKREQHLEDPMIHNWSRQSDPPVHEWASLRQATKRGFGSPHCMNTEIGYQDSMRHRTHLVWTLQREQTGAMSFEHTNTFETDHILFHILLRFLLILFLLVILFRICICFWGTFLWIIGIGKSYIGHILCPYSNRLIIRCCSQIASIWFGMRKSTVRQETNGSKSLHLCVLSVYSAISPYFHHPPSLRKKQDQWTR